MYKNGRVRRVRETSSVPRYIQVRQQLIRRILDGTLPPGSKLPSEPELAAQLGVSRMTANKSLIQLAREGWVHRRKGSGTYVSTHMSRQIMIAVCTDVTDQEFLGLHTLETFASLSKALNLKIGVNEYILSFSGALRFDSRPAGIIAIAPSPRVYAKLGEFQALGIPCVTVGGPAVSQSIPHYGTSRIRSAEMALDHLAGHGHTRLLVIDSSEARVAFWRQTFSAARETLGLEHVEIYGIEVEGNLGPDSPAFDHLRTAWRRPPGFTAIFAGAPRLAVFAHAFATRFGLRIPDDFSLIGFDDPEYLGLLNPAVSALARPNELIVSTSLQDLIQASSDPDFSPPGLLAEPQLRLRSTTGPWPQAKK